MTDSDRTPVRVLHVLGRLSAGGGVQIVVRRLAAALDPDLVELHVQTVRPLFPHDRIDEVPTASIVGMGLTGRGYRPSDRLRVLVEVARHVRALRPDVIQLHSGTAWFGLLARATTRRLPVVIEVHDAPGSGRHGRRSDQFEGLWVSRFGATAVCHSSSVAADIAREWSPPPERVVSFPLSVDTDLFVPPADEAERTRWRLDHDIRPDAPVLVVVGRFVPSKRFDLAVRALAEVRRKGVDADLVLVGSGPDDDAITATAERLGVTEHVHAIGDRFDTDLVAAIQAADVMVSTSAYEGFGLTIVEAMACARPVVAVAVGGVTDLIDDGDTGFLVADRPADDLVAPLADAVTAVLQLPDRGAGLGANGRRKAERLYSGPALATAFTTLYRRLGGRSTTSAERPVEEPTGGR